LCRETKHKWYLFTDSKVAYIYGYSNNGWSVDAQFVDPHCFARDGAFFSGQVVQYSG
jgi:hypothetical protein